MADEVKKVEEGEKESTWKRLMKVSEFRMMLYIIPVAIILFIVASLLRA